MLFVQAVEMYTDLREFKLAKKSMSTNDPGTKDLLAKQAQWAVDINDLVTAWYVCRRVWEGGEGGGMGKGQGSEAWKLGWERMEEVRPGSGNGKGSRK